MKRKTLLRTLIIAVSILTVIIAFSGYVFWCFTGPRYFETMTGLSLPYKQGSFIEGKGSFMVPNASAYMKLETDTVEKLIKQKDFKLMTQLDWEKQGYSFSSGQLPDFSGQKDLFILYGKNKYFYPYTWTCIINKRTGGLWIRVPRADASGD